jgi:hypothetical protein
MNSKKPKGGAAKEKKKKLNFKLQPNHVKTY